MSTRSSVVSYRNSTSNHNSLTTRYDSSGVVSYRNSTSNHNNARRQWRFQQLYLIEILHQTTTFRDSLRDHIRLYLIEILHQTTTPLNTRFFRSLLYLIEILHQTTTTSGATPLLFRCILSKFYIKPQLPRLFELSRLGCILSKFYIKPQLLLVY